MNIELARRQMLTQQLRTWEVLDPGVLETFEAVPREHFVPDRYARLCFADTEIPLGKGQVMLRPSVGARLVQALTLSPDDEVLEVGSGSGFLSACLGRLAATVHGLEFFEELAAQATENLCETGVTNVTVEHGDATRLARPGRYDAVLVSCAVPDAERAAPFREALKVGGRLVMITGREPLMHATLMHRVSALEWTDTPLFETTIPELIDPSARPPFDF